MGVGGGRNETELERLDRNLGELVGELRVAATGVQVLFGFLLILPFNSRFAMADDFERALYALGLGTSALAALCFLATTARHRLLFREEDKRSVVFTANMLTIAGLAFLALALPACIALALSRVFGTGAGAGALVVGLLGFGGMWFAVPLRRRALLRRRAS